VKKIFEDIIKERVQQGLIQAINSNNPQPTEQDVKANKLDFTELEHQALLIIKAIASELEGFDINRITADDCQGHCNIILDGQARNKKICVLQFNNPNKLSISISNIPYNLNSPSDILQTQRGAERGYKGVYSGLNKYQFLVINMLKKIAIISILSASLLTGCDKEVPKCSDEGVINLVIQIALKLFFSVN